LNQTRRTKISDDLHDDSSNAGSGAVAKRTQKSIGGEDVSENKNVVVVVAGVERGDDIDLHVVPGLNGGGRTQGIKTRLAVFQRQQVAHCEHTV
jgi:hypothetical protein